MNLAELDIVITWKALGGGPLKGRRGSAFWRNGDGLNVALFCEKNVFFDHASGIGGGPLALVMLVQGCDKEYALRWLERHCGLVPQDRLGDELRRDRRVGKDEVAERVMRRHAALRRDLEHTKVATYRDYLAHPGKQTDRSWEQAQQLGSAALVAAHRNALKQDPDAVERLVKAAREDLALAELYTSLVVALLGVSALRGRRRHE